MSREYRKRARKRAKQEAAQGGLDALYSRSKRSLVRLAKSELTEQERKERTQARVGLASNVLGIAAGTAALATAAKNPALRKPTAENAGPVTRRMLKKVKTPKGKAGLVAAGAAGALGLQAANLGGDVVANRVLSRESGVGKADKKDVAAQVAGGTIGGAAGAGAGMVVDRTFRAQARAANAPLKGVKFRAKDPMPPVGTLMQRSELKAKSTARSAGAKSARFVRRNKAALIGATIAGGLSAMPVEKSIEQSFVSKSDEVLVTGHGVNIEKRKAKDKDRPPFYTKGDKAAIGISTAGSAVGGGILGGIAGHVLGAETRAPGRFRVAGAALGAGALGTIGGLQARRDIRQARAMKIMVGVDRRHLQDVKKRDFNAEADRQRRLGAYAGLGAVGAAGFGAAAARGLEMKGRRSDGQIFALKSKKKAKMPAKRLAGRAGLAGLAAGSGLAGLAAYRRGISERNYPYL